MGCKKDFREQVEALQSQAKSKMNDATVVIDERIEKVVDLYKQTEALADEGSLDNNAYESLLADSAKFFYDYGLYREALSRYSRLVTLRESLYGQDHPITATAYHDIGEVYRNLCNYSKALEYQTKALDIRKKILGEKHLDTAQSYNETGLVYFYQGYYEKALELIIKAKSIREELVSINHPDTAESLANIGLVKLKTEENGVALENYLKALKIYESTLGREKRETAVAYYGIGVSYFQQGNHSEALEYYSRALPVVEKELGLKHPDTALVYIALGYIHCDIMGGFTKALEYITKSLEINVEVLGYEHINTAMSYSALGWVKYKMGEHQETLECYEKSLAINKKILGSEHPDTAEAYYNIGFICYLIDDNDKAHEYYLKALEIYKEKPSSEFIDRKKKEIESFGELCEGIKKENSKGTRDLFLETLTEIGCQYEIDEGEEGYISFGYQGENFVVRASNSNPYIQIYDSFWGHVGLQDFDEVAKLKKAINESNIRNSVTTVYTIDETGKNVYAHCKSVILFTSEISDLTDYLRIELNEYFRVHNTINTEMFKQKERDAGQ